MKNQKGQTELGASAQLGQYSYGSGISGSVSWLSTTDDSDAKCHSD